MLLWMLLAQSGRCQFASLKLGKDRLGRALAAVHAIGNSNAAQKPRPRARSPERGRRALDFRDAVKMAHCILRHRLGPSVDPRPQRRRLDAEQRAELLARGCDHLGVVERHHLALHRAADERAHQDRSGRRAAGELQTGEAAGDDSAMLDRGHHEAETSRRPRKIAFAVGQSTTAADA